MSLRTFSVDALRRVLRATQIGMGLAGGRGGLWVAGSDRQLEAKAAEVAEELERRGRGDVVVSVYAVDEETRETAMEGNIVTDRQCTTPGCTFPVRMEGLCFKCLTDRSRQRQAENEKRDDEVKKKPKPTRTRAPYGHPSDGGPLRKDTTMSKTKRCSVPECGKTVFCRGLCGRHYNWKSSTDAEKLAVYNQHAAEDKRPTAGTRGVEAAETHTPRAEPAAPADPAGGVDELGAVAALLGVDVHRVPFRDGCLLIVGDAIGYRRGDGALIAVVVPE